MSTKDFRAAVVAKVMEWAAVHYPTLPLIFENGPVPDEDKIGPIWLDLEIRWYGAKELGVGQVFSGRHSGAVSANVFYREGAGTGEVDDIIDSLKSYVGLQRLGGGVIRFPQRTVPSPQLKGWYRSGLLFPFTLDE